MDEKPVQKRPALPYLALGTAIGAGIGASFGPEGLGWGIGLGISIGLLLNAYVEWRARRSGSGPGDPSQP